MKPPPESRKPVTAGNPEDKKRARKAARLAQNFSVRERLLKGTCILLIFIKFDFSRADELVVYLINHNYSAIYILLRPDGSLISF
jgi:hypothetical protein